MAKAKNERNTENIVRDLFQKLGYKDNPKIIVEEQQTKRALFISIEKGFFYKMVCKFCRIILKKRKKSYIMD